jgi:hypothetical protein
MTLHARSPRVRRRDASARRGSGFLSLLAALRSPRPARARRPKPLRPLGWRSQGGAAVARRVLATHSGHRVGGSARPGFEGRRDRGASDGPSCETPSSSGPRDHDCLDPEPVRPRLSSPSLRVFSRPAGRFPSDQRKTQAVACVLSGLLCSSAVRLAQHRLPDVRIDNTKREVRAHTLARRVHLLASHGRSIIGAALRLSRGGVCERGAHAPFRLAAHSSARIA